MFRLLLLSVVLVIYGCGAAGDNSSTSDSSTQLNLPGLPGVTTVTPTTTANASNRVELQRIECAYPIAGEPLLCVMTGKNLPDAASIQIRNCSPNAMQLQAGGSASEKRFLCTPNASATSLSYSVPGLTGTPPSVVFNRFLDWGTGTSLFPTTKGTPTRCADPLASDAIPATTQAGDFKIYAGECFASLTLNDTQWNQIIASNGAFDVDKFVKRFTLTFNDSFDFLNVVLDTQDRPTTFPYEGAYSSYNTRAPTRTRRLLGVMVLPRINSTSGFLNPIEGGPMLHELMHEWANNGVIPSPSDAPHWGFSSVGGQLGGWHGPSGVTAIGTNLWQASGVPFTCLAGATASDLASVCSNNARFGTFSNGGNAIGYAPLELMLMGLIPASSVPDIRIAIDGVWVDNRTGKFSASDWRTVTATEIMRNLGSAAPDISTSQKHFRLATLVLTNKSVLAVPEINTLNRVLSDFSADANPQYGLIGNRYLFLHNFHTATQGLASIRAGDLRSEIR
jgi:hypothetical protein